jgi:hypothetical protein
MFPPKGFSKIDYELETKKAINDFTFELKTGMLSTIINRL